MPIPDRIDDHVAPALKLLTDAYAAKPVTVAFLSALVRPNNDLEAATWDVLWGRTLDDAYGNQLDVLGRIVGELRRGKLDEQYRAAIRLRIRVNRSQGRAEDVLQIAVLANPSATYVEYFPFAWEVSIYDDPTSPAIIELLTQAKAKTSYGVLLTSTWPEASVFKFSHAGESSPTNVWASAYSATPDKRFPAALPTNPPYRTYTS